MYSYKTIKIKITGRVQAVFFRDSVKRIADRNNLRGKVENKSDGSVEIVASGEESGIRNLLDWCYRGSLLSRVESLSYEFVNEKTNIADGFVVDKHEKSYFVDKLYALRNFSKRYYRRYFKKNKQSDIQQEKKLEQVPLHVAIIPDGNRRWAKERGEIVWNGHNVGADNLKSLIEVGFKNNIKYITAWGFSTENWSRDQEEVNMLMEIFLNFIKINRQYFIENKIRFYHFGRKDRISDNLKKEIEDMERLTEGFSDHNFAIALDYGGQDEIRRAAESYASSDKQVSFEKFLDTTKFPEADLIIRTGGEQRSSGMMPWQSAYAEYYFSPLYFPDFNESELMLALQDFANRKRRFGK